MAAPAAAQPPVPDSDPEQAVAPAPAAETIDVFDLLRKLRHKEADAQTESWDYRKPMMAFAPVIGAKPSAGVLFGAAGNVAFYRGDPSTTRISSIVTSLTFSTKKQISLTNRFTMFARENRWRHEGDYRFQWTSLETFGLGTSADTSVGVQADFDFFRLYHTSYYRLLPELSAGAGLYFDNHTDVGPRTGEESAWTESRTWNTASATAFRSTRRSRPARAWICSGTIATASSTPIADGWRRPPIARCSTVSSEAIRAGRSQPRCAHLRGRLARPPSQDRLLGIRRSRRRGRGALFDLPSTAGDTYGRSARGYAEGQFRGERLAYGEIEYRATLMRNGLLGMVAFLNTTTVTNLDNDEHLFDSFATAAGAGLRLLINKRSKTNLCLDVGFGKQGSKGVYLAIQEAF